MSRVMLLPPKGRDAEVTEHVVLVHHDGRGVGTEVDKGAARTQFVFGQYGLRQGCRCNEQVGNFYFGLFKTELEVLLERSAGHDVQKLTCNEFTRNAYRFGIQIVVYLVLLRRHVQDVHVHDGEV